MKPIYKVLIAIVALAVVIFVIIFVATSNTPTLPVIPPAPSSTPEIAAEEPAPQQKTFTKLSENPVLGFWTVTGTKEVFYVTPEGAVWSLREGLDVQASSQTFEAINGVWGSPNGTRALMAFGNPNNPRWAVFDAVDKVWKPLPETVTYASWSTTEDTVLAISESGDNRSLVSLNIAKNPPVTTVLFPRFSFRDVSFTATSPETFYMTERPSATYAGRVLKVDTKRKTVNTMLSPELGFTLSFSHDKTLAFKTAASQAFFILTNTLSFTAPIPLRTIPSKCDGVNGTIAYCFVPREQVSSRAVVPDEFLTRVIATPDDLYAITVATGDFRKVFDDTTAPAIHALRTVVLGETLYVFNAYDASLYEYPLVQ